MRTDYKLNRLGMERVIKIYESELTWDYFLFHIFAFSFFISMARLTRIYALLIFLIPVPFLAYFSYQNSKKHLTLIKNNNYYITQHILLKAIYSSSGSDDFFPYTLVISGQKQDCYQSTNSSSAPRKIRLRATSEDYNKYCNQLYQPIYLINVGRHRHLVHPEELEANYNYNY